MFAELSKRETVLELKEIFIFTMKSIFNLSIGTKSKSVDLVKRNHALLYELSRNKFMPFLDMLTINLNENISEAIKRADNPWIESIWEEIIDYLNRLFLDYLPRELIDNEIFNEVDAKPLPVEFSSLEAKMLLNAQFVSFKCRFVVNFMKLAQIILRNTMLPSKSREELFKLIDNSLTFSKTFNSKSLHRFILWKKGYFSNQNSLPSLYIFEINVHLAKFFHYKKLFPSESTEVLQTIAVIFQNYLEKLEATESVLESIRDGKSKFLAEEDLNREFKEKNFVEKQTSTVLYFDIISDNIAPFLAKIDLSEQKDLSVFDVLLKELVEFVSRANIHYYANFKCLNCLNCQDCDSKFSRLKRNTVLEDFLKTLIAARIKRAN